MQAKHPAAAGASEMHVLRMFVVGVCRREAKHSLPIDRLVRQTRFCSPVKDAVQGDAINSRKPIFANQCFYVAMAERLLSGLKKT